MNDRRQEPNRFRRQHDEFIQKPSTTTAGEFVWQRYDDQPVIDWLFDRRMIDDNMHTAAQDYREDCIAAGLWRSPPSAAYGKITGGEEGSGLARTRVLQADAYINATVASEAHRLLRNVVEDTATIPVNGPPYWIRQFRLVAGRLAAWRRMDVDDVRKLRLSRIEG